MTSGARGGDSRSWQSAGPENMKSVFTRIGNSPTLSRVVPFVVFLALTGCQDYFGEAGRYWFYLLKTAAAGWMLWGLRSAIPEMQWRPTWEAVLTGVVVFVVWVGIDGWYLPLDELLKKIALVGGEPGRPFARWNPHVQFGEGSVAAWFFIVIRITGASLVVPLLEEVFFRSFLYRFLVRADFLSVPLGRFVLVPFVVTSVFFGLEHREWLAGILCGLAYQGLVCWKRRLGDAIVAHAVTNFLLGLWVTSQGAWQFW